MPPTNQPQFITITLPPRFYKKKVVDQILILKQALKSYSENFFDRLEGKVEVTSKCNAHFHGMGVFREQGTESAAVAKLKFLDHAREFSRVDVQIIKNFQNVQEYIEKDVADTMLVTGLPERAISYKYVRLDIQKDLCQLPQNINIL